MGRLHRLSGRHPLRTGGVRQAAGLLDVLTLNQNFAHRFARDKKGTSSASAPAYKNNIFFAVNDLPCTIKGERGAVSDSIAQHFRHRDPELDADCRRFGHRFRFYSQKGSRQGLRPRCRGLRKWFSFSQLRLDSHRRFDCRRAADLHLRAAKIFFSNPFARRSMSRARNARRKRALTVLRRPFLHRGIRTPHLRSIQKNR